MSIYKRRFKKSIRSPLGRFGYFMLLVQPLWRLIELGGDIEFLASNMSGFIGFLSTGWGVLACSVVGIVIIAITVFRAQRYEYVSPAIELRRVNGAREEKGSSLEWGVMDRQDPGRDRARARAPLGGGFPPCSFDCMVGSQFRHGPRFPGPPNDPGRSVFPSPVLALACPSAAFP